MSNFLLLLILFVLASVLLLIVYLIDRVNIIEKVTLTFTGESKLAGSGKSNVFGDLQAEHLWGAMSGMPTPGWDEASLNELRPRYEVILQKHFEGLFEEGFLDGKEGIEKEPNNNLTISSLRGNVESWIPQQNANSIYQLGKSKVTMEESGFPALREQINTEFQRMVTLVGITPQRPIADTILPIDNVLSTEDNSDQSMALGDGNTDRLAGAIHDELNPIQPETPAKKQVDKEEPPNPITPQEEQKKSPTSSEEKEKIATQS